MKFLFDFFPILLFFAVYKIYDIYTATAVLIAACVVQVTGFWLKNRRFETAHIVTLTLVLVFGGATLLLHDEMFIKWKLTVLYWLFAAACIGSQFIGSKCLIERMMGSQFALPSEIWIRLNMAWATFFMIIGVLNLYVVYNFDTDTWVNFKLFGVMGLMLAFTIAQAIYVMPYLETDPAADE